MKTLRALGLLGEMEAARAAVSCQDATTADLVVGLLVAMAPAQLRLPEGDPVWLGIDLAAPSAEGGTP